MSNPERALIEAGHYYQSYGPTFWSNLGVAISKKISSKNDHSMLFVDDVHPLENVSRHEVIHPVVPLIFDPDHTTLESSMIPLAHELQRKLMQLPKKLRPELNKKNGKYFMSGFPITHPDGRPTCVLLDAALSMHKYHLGYKRNFNVLPLFYEEEQHNLTKIFKRIFPSDFELQTILFNEKGEQVGNVRYTNLIHHEVH